MEDSALVTPEAFERAVQLARTSRARADRLLLDSWAAEAALVPLSCGAELPCSAAPYEAPEELELSDRCLRPPGHGGQHLNAYDATPAAEPRYRALLAALRTVEAEVLVAFRSWEVAEEA